jgi:hypothetical protein
MSFGAGGGGLGGERRAREDQERKKELHGTMLAKPLGGDEFVQPAAAGVQPAGK